MVVEHPVGLVPHPLALERLGDARVVLEELEHQVGAVPAAVAPEDERDPAHRQRVERHPPGGVGLLEDRARRQVRAVDRADVVQAEEAALEQVVAEGVFPVHPPGEVDQQLVEDPREEVEVLAAVEREHLKRRPRLDRRVDVAEVPLVGGQRPVRVLEPLPAQQHELVLGEPGIDVRQGHAVEGQVPGGEPRVLPLVGHRQDVEGVEVPPARVAVELALRRRRRLRRVAVQPGRHVVVVELLGPEHPGERLAHDVGLVGAGAVGRQRLVELVRLGLALAKDKVKGLPERVRWFQRPASA